MLLGLAACWRRRRGAAADINVILDQAKLVKLPERVATIVIGNPLIADATVQTGGLMVITGKGYGATNIIALDRTGAVLMERPSRCRGRAPTWSWSIAASSARPIAARPIASGGSRSATAQPISTPTIGQTVDPQRRWPQGSSAGAAVESLGRDGREASARGATRG